MTPAPAPDEGDSALHLLLAELAAETVEPEQFLARQFDLGLAWVHFRVGEGGLGLPSARQEEIRERLGRAGAPDAFHRNALGVGMVAPTIHDHGTPEQRARLLRPLFSGAEIWCQLFSEPSAGSDLAGVATSARRRADGRWTVNGQKVWTSYAHKARWGLLLARTDPDVPKHEGLTTFVLDMGAPGVDIRPLYQMTGDAEFNEVFLDEVEIADEWRLGAVGDGWRVVTTTLLNERVAIGGRVPQREEGAIGEAVRAWRELDDHSLPHRDALVQLWVRAEVARLANARAASLRDDSSGPGPEGWISKVVAAELNQDITALLLDLLGSDGLLKPGGYPLARSARDPFQFAGPAQEFLRAKANSLEGGTSEIARNVLGERILGLPAEPRVDRGVPWSAVPRA